ncbi:MAG: VWA domain-containing protein [Methanotrichaceae archaeon]|nr:VWA domain-containing protein [Methanotrichaceae archaeon]
MQSVISVPPYISAEQNVSFEDIWTSDSGKSPSMSKVTLMLGGQGELEPKPIYSILAIDSSSSMTITDPKNDRLSAAQKFIGRMDKIKDKVGIVSWDDNIDLNSTISLTNDFNIANRTINSIDSYGNTSLDMGLSKSINLLSNVPEGVSKVVVFLSDGNGTYTASGLSGSQVDLARNQGITLYTIGLGNGSAREYLMQIADTTGGKYYVATDSGALDKIYQDITRNIMNVAGSNIELTYALPDTLETSGYSETPMIETGESKRILKWTKPQLLLGQDWTTSFDVSSNKVGSYPLAISPDSVAKYTKYDGSSGSSALKEKVLNVMGSGMFSLAGTGFTKTIEDKTGVLVAKSVEPGATISCPDVTISLKMPPMPSRINIVFALDSSGSMKQQYVGSETHLESMSKAISNALLDSSVFRNSRISFLSWDNNVDFETEPINVSDRQGIEDALRLLNSNESETTVYAVGLKGAIDKLNAMPILDPYNTRGIIVFVTGLSEFDPNAIAEAIQEAKTNGYAVYTVGLGILNADPSSEEFTTLKMISETTGGTGPREIQNFKDITDVISNISNEILAKPIATNVIITDTLYPYLKVLGTDPAGQIVNNAYGTTTIIWNLGGLPGETKRVMNIQTVLEMNLPVDVVSNNTRIGYDTVEHGSNSSALSYMWFTGEERHIELPEGQLSINCGVPITCSDGSNNPGGDSSGQNASEGKKLPGFECVLAVISITIAFCLNRRR